MRKTKIVCTIGPASEDKEMLRKLIQAGMNVVRLNFSHGDFEEHGARVKRVKELRQEMGIPVALLLDTKGPEIRTGKFDGKDTVFAEGSTVVIRHEDVIGNAEEFSVSYKQIHEDLKVGDTVLIDDGLVGCEVTEIKDKDVVMVVRNSGNVSSNKSINLPDTYTQLPALTPKDEADLEYAAQNDFDFIAASFVRKASDVEGIRELLKKVGGETIQIISKIENREGVDNYKEILEASDGIMVARGDLGVEIPPQEVPAIQKWMIQLANEAHKPVITATQMLDSMIRNPRPTRAEVSDVANAIYDGTSAIMLSGESANGKYPEQAVKMMASIADTTEAAMCDWEDTCSCGCGCEDDCEVSIDNAIASATCATAKTLGAKAILTMTQSGRTPRLIASHHPGCPIIVTTTDEKVRRQTCLTWGTKCLLMDETSSTDEIIKRSEQLALDAGLIEEGDIIVVTGGTPLGQSGSTNTLKVVKVGENK